MWGGLSGLDEFMAGSLARLAHGLGPDAGLYLADVGFVEHEHAQTALTDTAADAQWQLVVEQLLVK
jgi:hypothetical protein